MDSQPQLVRSHEQHGHSYEADHDHHLATGDQDEHHHGKTSVLKKVKAKAKKLKDTLTKHGHGHDNDDEEDDDEDEEDEQMIHHQEVHDPPAYESGAGKRAVPGRMGNRGHFGDNLGSGAREEGMEGERVHVPSTNLPLQQGDILSQPPATMGKEPHSYDTFSTGINHDPTKAALHGPATHTYAGGEEETPIIKSFGKLSVNDESQGRSNNDQDSSNIFVSRTDHNPREPTQTLGQTHHDHNSTAPGLEPFAPEQVLPRESSIPPEYSQNWPENVDRTSNGSSYTSKISSAVSAITDRAISAKNAVASKLGYGGNEETRQKVAGKGPGNEGTSVKDYLAEKLRPGEEERALSEMIGDALHRRRKEPEEEEERPPVERVTESEEVKRRLGSSEGRAGQKVAESYVNSPGDTVVDKLRGAVGSWFGAADPIQQSSSGNGGSGEEAGRDGSRGVGQ